MRAQVAMRRGRELRCQRRQAATPLAGLAVAVATIAAVVISGHGQALGAEAWNGLTIAPEHRCSPYDSDDYYYSRSVEAEIVAAMDGKIYGPYTGRHFASTRETDIEHIVARSEAHDSGLCAASPELRWRFASDLLNLTLAAPEVNRCWSSGKCAHDAAEWLPPMNKCWFAARVVAVKRKYALTVDRREADALEGVLSACASTDMLVVDGGENDQIAPPTTESASVPDPLRLWDDNGNGRITCKEARRHGIAPVPRGHSAYPFMFDRDGDGEVCE